MKKFMEIETLNETLLNMTDSKYRFFLVNQI